MTAPWNAEIEVDIHLAQSLITNQFPQLEQSSLKPFGQGWDNTAFLVDDLYIFRFPRRKQAIPLLEDEIRLLPKLARALTMPIPNPIFIGTPSTQFPYPFAGYRMLPGRPACSKNLQRDERSALAQPLGRFLQQLHGLNSTALDWSPSSDRYHRTDLAILRQKLEQGLDELTPHLNPSCLKAARRFVARERAFTSNPETLVHGDLYVRHLLLNDSNQLSGVIDWGDLHLGDAAVDLAIAWNFLPRQSHQAFLDAYGRIPQSQEWEMAHLRGLFHGVALLRYGLSVEDADLIREGRFIFDNVLE